MFSLKNKKNYLWIILITPSYLELCAAIKWMPAELQVSWSFENTVKILNIGTYMSEQTVSILIRLLLRSSLIRIYTVCHSVHIFWRHYCIVKSYCFILKTATVVSQGVQIFRVFTVILNFFLISPRKRYFDPSIELLPLNWNVLLRQC